MLRYCFILMLFAGLSARAQVNLVPNGGFEDTVVCGESVSGRFGAVEHWFVPQNDVIDVTKPCNYVDWWRFIRDKKVGRNDSRSGFIETYYKGFADDGIYSGRRYLAVKLKEPLKAGEQYYFEMYIRALDTFPNYKLVNTVFTDGQDVAFTKEFPTFDFDLPRNFLPLKPLFRSKLHQNYNWHKVNGCFTADGGEAYLIIGNFRNDANTVAVPTNKRNDNFPNGQNADYAIDDVILTPMTLNFRDTAVCVGETLRLDVTRSIPDSISYQWHDGKTTPQYEATKTDNVYVTVNYPAGCSVGAGLRLNVITPDYRPVVRDTLVCASQNVTFTAGVRLKGESISWENGANTRDLVVNTEGLYVARITSQCAQWTDSFRLKKRECGEGIFVPTAFSPNGDGQNDDFRPFIKAEFQNITKYDFKVFNRWGNLIFQSTNPDDAWDGNWLGKAAISDTYVWFLTIEHNNRGKPDVFWRYGDVHLAR